MFYVSYMLIAGALNLWRGTGANQWPHTIKRMAVTAFLLLPLAVSSHDWVLVGVCYLLVLVLGFSMGWGAYFDMTDRPNRDEVKWIDRIIRRVAPDNFARQDYLGLSLRGLQFTVPVSVFLSIYGSPIFLVFAPFGAFMAPVYKYVRDRNLGTPTAEVAWGGLLGALYLDLGIVWGLV